MKLLVLITVLMLSFKSFANSGSIQRLVSKAHTMVEGNEQDIKKMSQVYIQLGSQLTNASLTKRQDEVVFRALVELKEHCENTSLKVTGYRLCISQ